MCCGAFSGEGQDMLCDFDQIGSSAAVRNCKVF